MFKLFIAVIAALCIAAGAFMYMKQDTGFVVFSFAEYQYQASLVVVGGITAGALVVLAILIRLYRYLNNVFAFFGPARQNRLAKKAAKSLSQGLIELAEGRFAKAEKILLSQAEHNDNVLLAYLAAARAAQHQGAHDRRDEYLRLAHKHTPTADVAIGLTKAELQLDHNQLEQALATLNHLRDLAPDHDYVLKLLVRTYQRLSDWNSLKELMPTLKKRSQLPQETVLDIEKTTWLGLLNDKSAAGKEALAEAWKEMPHHIKTLPEVVEHYARLLMQINAVNEAEELLRRFIHKNWNESTVELYSELNVIVDNKALETVEGWLESHQHNAHLLLSLGKLCMGLNLWGKARSYLEASLAVMPLPETYRKLAMLLEEHMDEPELALENYKKGMHLLAGEQEDLEQSLSTTITIKQESDKPELTVV